MCLCVDTSYFKDCPVIQNPNVKEANWSFKSKKEARELLLAVIVGAPITSKYTLQAVDLKDMVVIDLWNAGEERPVKTLIRRRVIPGEPVAGPGTSQN